MGPGMWAGGSIHLALAKDESDSLLELVNREGLGGVPEEFHRRCIYARPNADEMPEEIKQELDRLHMNLPSHRLGTGGGLPSYMVDSHVANHILNEMMDECHVKRVLSAYAADPIMEGPCVKGLYVETKSGRQAIKAKVVIDATGQADVAFRAGASCIVNDRPNLGLYFVLGGVDRDKYFAFREANSDPDPADVEWIRNAFTNEKSEADPYACPPHLIGLARQAWESGEFEFVRKIDACIISLGFKDNHFVDGMAGGRTGTVGHVDFSNARLVSLMEREHREHVYQYALFSRRHVPGFENCYLMFMSPFLGARGGRYLDGVRPVTGDDLVTEQRFDDVIYIFSSGKHGKSCDVPYRSQVPKEVDGLLAAGRSAFVYGPNFRMRYSVMLNGQAAGLAAALCAQDSVQPRDLDVKKLQRKLRELRCPLGNRARLEELGLE
jgi:hypothetical protein